MDLITQTLPFAEVNDGLAQQLTRKWGLKSDVSLIRKSFAPEDFRFEPNETSSIDYVSTKTKDRDGDIVEPSGALLYDYLKNPVVMWSHDYSQLPLGKCKWIRPDEWGISAKTVYATEANPFAKQVYEYRKAGFPLGKSIGFIPLETGSKKGARQVHLKYLVLEYSDCPIPSNPDALAICVSKGLVQKPKPKKKYYYRLDDELIVDGEPIEFDIDSIYR